MKKSKFILLGILPLALSSCLGKLLNDDSQTPVPSGDIYIRLSSESCTALNMSRYRQQIKLTAEGNYAGIPSFSSNNSIVHIVDDTAYIYGTGTVTISTRVIVNKKVYSSSSTLSVGNPYATFPSYISTTDGRAYLQTAFSFPVISRSFYLVGRNPSNLNYYTYTENGSSLSYLALGTTTHFSLDSDARFVTEPMGGETFSIHTNNYYLRTSGTSTSQDLVLTSDSMYATYFSLADEQGCSYITPVSTNLPLLSNFENGMICTQSDSEYPNLAVYLL